MQGGHDPWPGGRQRHRAGRRARVTPPRHALPHAGWQLLHRGRGQFERQLRERRAHPTAHAPQRWRPDIDRRDEHAVSPAVRQGRREPAARPARHDHCRAGEHRAHSHCYPGRRHPRLHQPVGGNPGARPHRTHEPVVSRSHAMHQTTPRHHRQVHGRLCVRPLGCQRRPWRLAPECPRRRVRAGSHHTAHQ